MKVTGLIAEYNPFHTGHLFHIETSRQLSHADFILVIMSGDFVQRGTPALLDKYTRAEMALLCGADAVIELPVCFSCASAESFAYGAVSLFDQLGVTNFLSFGSECGNLSLLQSAAEFLIKESSDFQKKIRHNLKHGISYPAARANAFLESYTSYFGDISPQEIVSLLSKPNNILGLEYLKALKNIQSNILPLTFPRQEAGYHDKQLYPTFASATALRNTLLSYNLEAIQSYIPKAAFSVLEREYQRSFPILADDFSLPLYYKIRSDIEKDISLSSYQDISPELEARIFNKQNRFTSFESFALLLKTKQYTLTRINRCLLHILLDIKKTAFCPPLYARLLGFRKSSSALLTAMKKNSSIPIITKTADVKYLPHSSLFEQDLFAADLYRKTQEFKFHTTLADEFTHPIIILP